MNTNKSCKNKIRKQGVSFFFFKIQSFFFRKKKKMTEFIVIKSKN